ncbi:hypothetical protein TCAL_13420, partial [Tigriopus californicus]
PSPGIGPNGTPSNSANRLEYIKNWTISTYKCSRQLLQEKMGKTSRTVDTELEGQIEALRDTQKKYSNILRLARALTSHFYHVVHTQTSLGEAFGNLANRSPELQEEFLYNADTQRNLVKNGEQLIGALNFFVSSVNTLCHKTMEDTIATVKVMHKQLMLFHNAVAAYFSGNQKALESTMKQFSINVKSPNSTKPSWVEDH